MNEQLDKAEHDKAISAKRAKHWRENNREHSRMYMREYMRNYRETKKEKV